MAEDPRPRFRLERPEASWRSYGLLLVLLVGVVLALLGRRWWEPRLGDGALVEVTGDVPRPGTYVIAEPTIARAIEAAGGEPAAFPDTPVPAGRRVVVEGRSARIAAPSDPLLVALPVDVNTADVDAIAAIPGVGRAVAVAIVDARADGPYRSVEDLGRARGVGADDVAALRPFVTVGDVPPAGPLDLNRASAAELERLPGIGSVTAARIVVDRADHGPYARIEDLGRVRGVGDATIESLRGLVTVAP